MTENHIKNLDVSRLYVTGLLLELARLLFSEAEVRHTLHPDLKEFYWAESFDPDIEKAKYQVLIESACSWTPDRAMGRPAILVKANAWEESRMGIGDSAYTSPSSGDKRKSRFISGTHTFFCIGTTEPQTELLAREVSLYLSQFAELIQKESCFHRFEVVQLAEINILEESDQHFVIPVVVAYQLESSWKLMPVSRLWQKAVVKVEQGL